MSLLYPRYKLILNAIWIVVAVILFPIHSVWAGDSGEKNNIFHHIVSLDDNPSYISLLGTYVTQKDLLVVEERNKKDTYTLEIPGAGSPKIEDIKKPFPFDYHGTIISDILPKGSVFQITHMERRTTPETNLVYFYATIGKGKFKDSKISVGMLADYKNGPHDAPVFSPEIAVKK